MIDYPSPCEKCTAKICQGTRCEPWKIRYLYRQKQINAYARKIAGRVQIKTNAWVYMHPDEYRRYLAKDPCDGCIASNICDTPCDRWVVWWNERMDAVRRRMDGI